MPLREDGRIAVDRIRMDTREQLRRIVRDPATARDLGLDGPAPGLQLPAALGVALVDTLANLDLLIVTRITGAPVALVREHAAWTAQEKQAVVPSLLAVANKYGGKVLQNYGDETALILTLVQVTTTKIALVRDAIARQTRPSVVVPIRTDDAPEIES